MTSLSASPAPERARFPAPRWWVSDRKGRTVIAQPPNAALVVWLLTVVAGWTGLVERAATLRAVGQGALIAWALDEILRGSSPARRALGGVVLVWELVSLFT